jgi:hypothetical protein
MAEKACHTFASTTQVGLTQVLGCTINYLGGRVMSRALLLFFLASFSASAQTVVPDRKVVQGHVYAYDKDGLRQYTATQPKSGVYRTIKYNYIETTDTYRINGLPCTVDCAEEMVGYRKARAKGIADIKDCPKESELKLEALGCSLWVLEQKK